MLSLKKMGLVSGLLTLLSGCWVPQIVEGVRPEVFDASPTPPPDVARQSLVSKEVALASRMVEISKTAADMFAIHSQVSRQRQAVQSHLYYNVKQTAGFPWQYQSPDYTYYNAQKGHRYTLSLTTAQGEKPEFDALGLSSYGDAPLPAKVFPDVKEYQLHMSETRYEKSVAFKSTGTWPDQVPLQGSFITDVTATGVEPDALLGFEGLTLAVTGKVGTASDFTGDLSFQAEIEGRNYNGFGRLDTHGFVDGVALQYNGVTQLRIERKVNTESASGHNWQIIKADNIIASVS